MYILKQNVIWGPFKRDDCILCKGELKFFCAKFMVLPNYASSFIRVREVIQNLRLFRVQTRPKAEMKHLPVFHGRRSAADPNASNKHQISNNIKTTLFHQITFCVYLSLVFYYINIVQHRIQFPYFFFNF